MGTWTIGKEETLTGKQYKVGGYDDGLVARIEAQMGLKPLTAKLLASRGIEDAGKIDRLMHKDIRRDWRAPAEIPGLTAACDAIEAAVKRGDRIAVFGDFDTDGVTSTAIMCEALNDLGCKAYPFIPKRDGEGYGLSVAAIDRMVAEFAPDTVITVDCGITGAEQVPYMESLGIEVIITDHHEPGDFVPSGVPVCDPRLDPSIASACLCGAGVALKIAAELGPRFGRKGFAFRFCELAALGTLADVMELTDENRAIVACGIDQMRANPRTGIAALARALGVDLAKVKASDLPFVMIPALNSAGRMNVPELACRLLMARDWSEAADLAARLVENNEKRKELQAAVSDEALAIAAGCAREHSVVIAGHGWHSGVKGIVAAKVADAYGVPALVFSIEDGIASGSGRSVGNVNLFEVVSACSDLLIRFGGHAGAVGLACEEGKLAQLADRLEELLSKAPAADFESRADADCPVEIADLDVDAIAEVESIQPFGNGNPVPRFVIKDAIVSSPRAMGAAGTTLGFNAEDAQGNKVRAIMFAAPRIDEIVEMDGIHADLICEPVINEFRGLVSAEIFVRDMVLG